MTTNQLSSAVAPISKDILQSIFKNISENELFVCSLCASMCTNHHRHQLVSTTCGHLFGKNCIRKRLKETSQCPSCFKTLEKRRDQQLRPMCLSSVVTIFPFEISRMRNERKQLRLRLNRMKTRLQRAKEKLSSNRRYLHRMNERMLKHSNRNKAISDI